MLLLSNWEGLLLRAISWKELVKICEDEGCRFDRQRGDHYIMTKPGISRPIVIPQRNDLKETIVFNIAKKALGLSRQEIIARLHKKKRKFK